MSAVDKAKLLASRGFGTQTVTIPEVGDVVIRGLSRAEVLSIQKAGALDVAVMEQKLLALALVDPPLTEDEVRQWQDNSPAGELQPVTEAVEKLSGIARDAVKEQMQTFRG